MVVYKVDRLTRSLADFARILEALDKRGVAFVSVTQAFNTNSSMGLGLICHKGGTYEGRHDPVVGQHTFDAVQALLSKQRVAWGRAPSLERAPLRGRVFDELGQSMRPAFVRQRGRTYSYYVGPVPMPGMVGLERSDVLRRVPCSALERIVRQRLDHLIERDERTISIEELRSAVARVEIRSDCAHLVLALRALRDLSPDLDSVARVEARLGSGDHVVTEVARPGHVRIAMPIRMKFRGGRTWMSDQRSKVGNDAALVRSAALKRLRLAHENLAPARPGLSTLRHVVRTARTPSVDYRKFAWAFLAPDIQSAILTGRLSSAAMAKLNNQSTVPLSWEVQRRLLGTNCAMEKDVVSEQTSPQNRLQ